MSRLGALAVTLLVVAACRSADVASTADGIDDQTVSSSVSIWVALPTTTEKASPEATPPTTTTLLPVDTSTYYEVSEPTYFPESLPGAGDFYGSGCAPGSDTLPDGIWFGHIESASAASIRFDLICFAPLEPGGDGAGTITNDNLKLRTVPISATAKVHAIAPDGFWELESYATWHQDPEQEGFCPAEGCWDVWLYINNGQVTEIVQVWFA